ncbi:WIPI1_2 [Lepeophtheirus salmonis]|uniref:WIPI1_2 n=1 Tax=Lepeophtheirus salmonis TaxID=72036 RepID=A0A7R8CG30_LEPSM|nr:WIPI1_2 [Lepeophtheirus salmonis]CAF2755630.1 WIPI1_2 [Lepeophtheirus salmonis]
MTGHNESPEVSPELVFTSFNQDVTSLAVGTTSVEDALIAERLFSSSLVAVVSRSAPRKLKVCHFKKGNEICNYSYPSKILSVKLNRARLVVCLEEALYIHNIRDMKVLHTIRDTPTYPGHSTIGEMQIFDAANLSGVRTIFAHSGQLAALQFSPSGTTIASASDKGTVIRVFSVSEGTKLYELRRGLKRTAVIHSLCFSLCGMFLACSSNTETVHIFRLEQETNRETDHLGHSPPYPDSWMGYLSTVVSAGANYLPTQVTDTLLQGRAFATVHHNHYGLKNVCALAVIKKVLRLLVASQDGYLYMYGLDVNEGGDCSLIRQFRLTNEQDASIVGEGVASGSDSGTEENAPPQVTITHRELAESEKFHEMEAAVQIPPKQAFFLDDDGEFPPVSS